VSYCTDSAVVNCSNRSLEHLFYLRPYREQERRGRKCKAKVKIYTVVLMPFCLRPEMTR